MLVSAMVAFVSRVSFCRSYRVRSMSGMALVAVLLGGCSISTPMAPLFGSKEGDDTILTGSITPKRFDPAMSDTEWGMVTRAVGEAFSPDNAASSARWKGEETAGSIVAVGGTYPDDTGLCRAFVARLESAPARWYQGRACRQDQEAWSIRRVSDWSPPG
jgi:17 kDa outer membrane surface antigen